LRYNYGAVIPIDYQTGQTIVQVSVRLSAALAQITGAARMQVTVCDAATVADVRQALLASCPALAPRLQHAVSMVGGNHASPTDIVSADQEVAFLMPVAGGAGRARLLRFL